jgi:hypothetical protein
MDRLEGAVPFNSLTAHFATRQARLSHCMEYVSAIGFLIVRYRTIVNIFSDRFALSLRLCFFGKCRLFGLKIRLTDFKLKKVIYKSDHIENSNLVSCSVELRPGRYAIIPFTTSLVNDLKGLTALFSVPVMCDTSCGL